MAKGEIDFVYTPFRAKITEPEGTLRHQVIVSNPITSSLTKIMVKKKTKTNKKKKKEKQEYMMMEMI